MSSSSSQDPLDVERALENFKDGSEVEKTKAYASLNEISGKLAKEGGLRRRLPTQYPSFWQLLSNNWGYLEAQFPNHIGYEPVICLARFTRNLVAGVAENQAKAFALESSIRRLLFCLSSHFEFEEHDSFPSTRMLVQCISNIITMNVSLAAPLWQTYTSLPEEQDILSRLLTSPDIPTVKSTLILILNIISPSPKMQASLITPTSIRILVRILDRTEQWANSDETDEEDAFVIAYRLFERFLSEDMASSIYHSLSLEDEPVTPHQTSFLKILDSYLQSTSKEGTASVSRCNSMFLPREFSRLTEYMQKTIRHSLGHYSDSNEGVDEETAAPEYLRDLDLRLPKVSAAVILISQCLTTICLQIHEHDTRQQGIGEGFKAVFDAVLAETFVEDLVDTLRWIDLFLPRIVFGQPVGAPGTKSPPPDASKDTKGFSYLKRDLVRLLGTISHEHKEIQDRVRKCGGIEVVMSLTVIDERNPYLQEHALFALRNLLHKNPENQAAVDTMKPVE